MRGGGAAAGGEGGGGLGGRTEHAVELCDGVREARLPHRRDLGPAVGVRVVPFDAVGGASIRLLPAARVEPPTHSRERVTVAGEDHLRDVRLPAIAHRLPRKEAHARDEHTPSSRRGRVHGSAGQRGRSALGRGATHLHVQPLH